MVAILLVCASLRVCSTLNLNIKKFVRENCWSWNECNIVRNKIEQIKNSHFETVEWIWFWILVMCCFFAVTDPSFSCNHHHHVARFKLEIRPTHNWIEIKLNQIKYTHKKGTNGSKMKKKKTAVQFANWQLFWAVALTQYGWKFSRVRASSQSKSNQINLICDASAWNCHNENCCSLLSFGVASICMCVCMSVLKFAICIHGCWTQFVCDCAFFSLFHALSFIWLNRELDVFAHQNYSVFVGEEAFYLIAWNRESASFSYRHTQ